MVKSCFWYKSKFAICKSAFSYTNVVHEFNLIQFNAKKLFTFFRIIFTCWNYPGADGFDLSCSISICSHNSSNSARSSSDNH